MRKGMEYGSQPAYLTASKRNRSSWAFDLFFPALLVGASYFVASTFFGF